MTGEVLDGLWRFEAIHPDWTEDEGGEEDGWEASVAWWAVAGPDRMTLIDPLVVDWPALDALVEGNGGCAGVIRTCYWHERSVNEAARRYATEVWAMEAPTPEGARPLDREVDKQTPLPGGLRAFIVQCHDELALWLPAQAALFFGDAMLRRADGTLRVCPDSWTQPEGGPARLREILVRLTELPVKHVLVSHGPLVLGDGLAQLRAALGH